MLNAFILAHLFNRYDDHSDFSTCREDNPEHYRRPEDFIYTPNELRAAAGLEPVRHDDKEELRNK